MKKRSSPSPLLRGGLMLLAAAAIAVLWPRLEPMAAGLLQKAALFTTVLDDSARSAGSILLSAGRIGRHIEISPAELARAIPFSYADVTAGEH